MSHHTPERYADDDNESIGTLFRLRAPALLIGFFLGSGISFVTSSFETVLKQNIQVAYFLPFIVYIAAAIGTQTEAIYSRDLKTGKARFGNYLHKELRLGIIFGLIFALCSGAFTLLWLQDGLLSLSIALAAFLAILTAPIVALIVTHLLQMARKDPAAGAGPIATVIQDVLSIVIYGLVTSAILL